MAIKGFLEKPVFHHQLCDPKWLNAKQLGQDFLLFLAASWSLFFRHVLFMEMVLYQYSKRVKRRGNGSTELFLLVQLNLRFSVFVFFRSFEFLNTKIGSAKSMAGFWLLVVGRTEALHSPYPSPLAGPTASCLGTSKIHRCGKVWRKKECMSLLYQKLSK